VQFDRLADRGVDEIAFVDLERQQRRLGHRLSSRIQAVLDHGRYIMGPEVGELEEQLSDRCGVRHAITCSNGTDALRMVLMAWGIGPGDAVFVPAYTFTSTAEVVALSGAIPVFCDVEPGGSYLLDPEEFEKTVARIFSETGLRPAAVIPVDLFGAPADYPRIITIAERFGIHVLADAAQSFGASRDGHSVGTLAEATATSFFPAKPLGCYGDGGAVFTDDDELASTLRSIRVHGQGSHKYDAVRIGLTARLDTIQAAVLLAKLEVFDEELERREQIAEFYSSVLTDVVGTPSVPPTVRSAWAQYTIRTTCRDALGESLNRAGVPTAIYYPTPLDRQTAYRRFAEDHEIECKVAADLATTSISLPLHPYLTPAEQHRVTTAVQEALETRA
jgi:dTDP-4-amino-4,6-dideoxygalactose transaminase